MKKRISFLLAVFLLVSVIAVPVFAAGEPQPEFRFELSVDGSDSKEVETGDIITVTLHLIRTDSDEAYTMYAMQDEIRYNSEFFELVEDSVALGDGIQSNDISVQGNFREVYMNFLSFLGGEQWSSNTRVGSFQLKVIGEAGVSTITNEDFLVSYKNGSGHYRSEANELTIILSTDCTVRFETNGGSKIDDVNAVYGEKISRPEDPTREGKSFGGWYKDIHLTQAWDFENDTVQGNITLYAKWVDAPVEIISEDNSAEEDPANSNDRGEAVSNGVPFWVWILIAIFILLIILITCFLAYIRKKMKKGKH